MTHSIQDYSIAGLSVVGSAAFSGAICSLTAALFTTINPVTGIIFGVTESLAEVAIGTAVNLGIPENWEVARTVARVASLVMSILAGSVVATAFGFPIGFSAACLLTAAAACAACVASLLFVAVGYCLLEQTRPAV